MNSRRTGLRLMAVAALVGLVSSCGRPDESGYTDSKEAAKLIAPLLTHVNNIREIGLCRMLDKNDREKSADHLTAEYWDHSVADFRLRDDPNAPAELVWHHTAAWLAALENDAYSVGASTGCLRFTDRNLNTADYAIAFDNKNTIVVSLSNELSDRQGSFNPALKAWKVELPRTVAAIEQADALRDTAK